GADQGHCEVTTQQGHRGVLDVESQAREPVGRPGDDPRTVVPQDGDGVLGPCVSHAAYSSPSPTDSRARAAPGSGLVSTAGPPRPLRAAIATPTSSTAPPPASATLGTSPSTSHATVMPTG